VDADSTIHLAILGVETRSGQFLSEAARLGIAERIHLLPGVCPEAVSEALQGADLAIIPQTDKCLNNAYCLPNKLFEAIHAGLPVVVSRLPEMSEMVTALGIGWTFQPGSAEDLTKVIQKALSNPSELSKRAAAAFTARQSLTWEKDVVPYLSALGAPFDKTTSSTS
ncbi:MAG: glycosyltransferase, partial [Holophaga sp.]